MTDQHLRRLSQLDSYGIANGDPDVRMWHVNDATGQRVGVVYDLMVDMTTLDVKFLDVALDRRAADREAHTIPHVLVPLALVQLADDANVVTLSQLTAPTLETLPEFDHNHFTREDQRVLLARLEWFADPDPYAGSAEEQRWFSAFAFRAGRMDDTRDVPYRVSAHVHGGQPGDPPPVS